MRSTELIPRSILPLTAVALLSLAACGDRERTADASRDVSLSTDTATPPALSDTAIPAAVVPPVETPTAAAPLVAGRAPLGQRAEPVPEVKTPSRSSTPRTAPKTAPAAQAPSAPSTPAPATAPSEPARSSGTVAAGTSFSVTSGAKVCSNTVAVGDRVTVTTNAPIAASNGVTIPAGARVGLTVTKSKTSDRQGDEAELAFDIRNVTFSGDTYPASGDVTTSAIAMERKGGDGKKVAIGAAAGAVIGNVIGGGSRAQRTVVGAAAGGAAGAVAAAVTGDRLACLPEGSTLTVRLGQAMTVRN